MLSQASRTVVPWPHRPPVDLEGELLDLLGPVDGLHVLVIGPGGLGPMLALHRRGAAGVTAVCGTSKQSVEAADAAIVPRVGTVELADAAIALARRSIRPLNSLVLRLTPSAPPSLLAHVRRQLQASGFSLGRVVTIGASTVVRAELPLYGRLKYA